MLQVWNKKNLFFQFEIAAILNKSSHNALYILGCVMFQPYEGVDK